MKPQRALVAIAALAALLAMGKSLARQAAERPVVWIIAETPARVAATHDQEARVSVGEATGAIQAYSEAREGGEAE